MRLPTQLLRRKVDSHKGDFGHIFIVAGSQRYSGALVLCGEAAIRSGAGLVTLGIPASLNNAVIKIKPKEVMTLPLPETREGSLSLLSFKKLIDFIKKIDILVIGPGLSLNKSTQALVRKLLFKIKKTIVLDADGINALAGHLDILKSMSRAGCITVMTPHPGEMSGLIGKSADYVQSHRKEVAQKFAQKYNLTLVLKGHHTVVSGSHKKLYINSTGNPGMATAGSGDVLTGIVASFLGQGLNSFEAAKFAVYVHGLAGDLAAKEKTQLGLIASDIIAKIPKAIKLSN